MTQQLATCLFKRVDLFAPSRLNTISHYTPHNNYIRKTLHRSLHNQKVPAYKLQVAILCGVFFSGQDHNSTMLSCIAMANAKLQQIIPHEGSVRLVSTQCSDFPPQDKDGILPKIIYTLASDVMQI